MDEGTTVAMGMGVQYRMLDSCNGSRTQCLLLVMAATSMLMTFITTVTHHHKHRRAADLEVDNEQSMTQ